MNLHRKYTKVLSLACGLAFLLGLNALQAQPVMEPIESGLEATKILGMNVRNNGRGSILLTCLASDCEKNKIKLAITKNTEFYVNGRRVRPNRVSQRGSDMVSAFYLIKERELTRLEIRR